MTCEKWADASAAAHFRGGSVTDHYRSLLEERKDSPCSPREQAGQWWDEERQCDRRVLGVDATPRWGVSRADLSRLLTQKEVNELPDGTNVWIRWSGGNGPWEYTVRQKQTGAYAEGCAAYIDFVGSERYHTQVRLAWSERVLGVDATPKGPGSVWRCEEEGVPMKDFPEECEELEVNFDNTWRRWMGYSL